MKKNTAAFSIVLAMGIVLILSFTGLYLLEYMVPFSKNIKGVENASQSYYEAYSGIEEGILLTYSGSFGYENSDPVSGNLDFGYTMLAMGDSIPVDGRGTSEFSLAAEQGEWNQLSESSPISLQIGDGIIGVGDNIGIEINVPDFNEDGSHDLLRLGDRDNRVLWQISNSQESLTARDIIDIPYTTNNFFTELGLELGDSTNAAGITIRSFYNSYCGSGTDCVLKLSVIDSLRNTSDTLIPYLEYQIDVDTQIPLSHTYIDSQGISYGFSRKLKIDVPQQSTSSVFDFTVLQ